MRSLLLAALLLALAACTTPAPTQPAAATVRPTDTATATDTPTDTSTPVPTWTARPTSIYTATPTASATASTVPSATATATRQPTVTPSRTLAPTATSDVVDVYFPATITITPPTRLSGIPLCVALYFPTTLEPGHFRIFRNNKGKYFDCVGNPVAQQQNARTALERETTKGTVHAP